MTMLGSPNIPALTGGVDWLAQVLTGTAATVIAMLTVATLGFFMLSGRIPARRAAEVTVGCFVLFCSRMIAAALLDTTQPVAPVPAPPVIASLPYVATTPKQTPYDPYAGASVPQSGQDRDIIK